MVPDLVSFKNMLVVGSAPPMHGTAEMGAVEVNMILPENVDEDLYSLYHSIKLAFNNDNNRIFVQNEEFKATKRVWDIKNKSSKIEDEPFTLVKREKDELVYVYKELESDYKKSFNEIKKRNNNEASNRLLSYILYPIIWLVGEGYSKSRYYQLDSSWLRVDSYTDSTYFGESGENLASILNKTFDYKMKNLKDKKQYSISHYEICYPILKDAVLSLLKVFIPEFEELVFEDISSDRVAYILKEKSYDEGFSSKIISEGTVLLLGVIVAAIYTNRAQSLIIIEEPDKGIHPTVFEELVEVFRKVAYGITYKDYPRSLGIQNQIILATHNRDLIRAAKPEEVYLFDKKDGKSVIKRASDVEDIEHFLKNFHLDELWLMDYLEGGLP